MFYKFLKFFIVIGNPLFAATIPVTSNDSFYGTPGSLGAALYSAEDGDLIDCSPITGQTIGFTGVNPLPAIGLNFASSTSSLTILGSGVTIDGGGEVTVFSSALGSATIIDFIIQNGISQGGAGGAGQTGGGGGTGGGGALYVHSGSTMTISAMSLNHNQAIGGPGGEGTGTSGAGGGGGGYGGGRGGASTVVASAGSGGGGGGNCGGVSGARNGQAATSNDYSNGAGAGGGGERLEVAGIGGSVAATFSSPAYDGGAAGSGTASHGAGGGGGAGSGGSGNSGSNSTDNGGDGRGGPGGYGFGVDNTYGGGGGGGGGNGGGAGVGTGGGGGGFDNDGGAGGVLGGGGGAAVIGTGGNGGFGAGGGGGESGGSDTYNVGGAGGSATVGETAGGGGGSGLGGAIFIQKGGLLIIQDGISFSDNSTTPGAGGTGMGSGAAGSSLGQDIFIRSGGGVTFQIDSSLTLSNPIEGRGSLGDVTGPGVTKLGAGTVTLTGVNTYLGDTLIQQGTLNLNGSVSGDIYTEPGGTLSGNATANGNIYNSGAISPGNSIGEIFTTDLYLYSGGVYNVEINSAGDSDEIIASGFAQVAGALLVVPDDTNFTTPLTYTPISTGSGITGKFSSLTSFPPALVSLTYNSLTIQITSLALGAVGLTGNALNAATGFGAVSAIPGSDGATINNILLASSFETIRAAFAQMGPAPFSSPTEIQLLDAILVRSTYTKHLQEFCFNRDRRCEKPISCWIDGIGQWQKQGGQFGYHDTTVGATIGVDYCMESLTLGVAFSTTYDSFHLKNFGGKGTLNSYYEGLYGHWSSDGFYMNVAFFGAQNSYRTRRPIRFATIDRHAHAKHHGNDWLTHVGLGYQVCSPHLQWTPYMNLDYVRQHEDSYTETGAGSLDLHVYTRNAGLFQGEAGVLLSTSYSAWNGAFIPMLTLAYINQTPLSGRNYYANFANASRTFSGRGETYERNLFAPCLTLTYQSLCDMVNASLYYDSEIGSGYWAQEVGFDITLRF